MPTEEQVDQAARQLIASLSRLERRLWPTDQLLRIHKRAYEQGFDEGFQAALRSLRER